MKMADEDLRKLKNEVEDALDDFRRGVDSIQEVMEQYHDLMNKTLCVALNTLITAGFVPNAKLKFDERQYKFLGYTEGLGMKFEDSEGNIINGGSTETTLKNLSRWTKE